MDRSSSERGQSFEEDVDAVDRGVFTGNPRLELEEDDDEQCILADPDLRGGELPNVASLRGDGHQDHGDEASVDSVQVYHDHPPSDSALIARVYKSQQQRPELDRVARNRLVAVSIFCSVFIIGEIVGGVLSNSVAIMTDAVHLASDLSSFIISLIAIYLAVKQPSSTYTFGLYRAEVIGATISILSIWLVTGILGYMAILRIIHHNFTIEPDDMLITASLCVVFNIIMALVLNVKSCSLPHSSFGHNHSHHHPPHDSLHQYTQLSDHSPTRDPSDRHHGNSLHHHGDSNHHHGNSVGNHGHSHSGTNINVKAAFIHVIGDLIQSIGILIAAIIIKMKPEYKLADPICTLLFAVVVLITTLYMLRDIFSVVLEATPRSLAYGQLCSDLRAMPGVKLVTSVHVWSLTLHKIAASAHLAVALGVDHDVTIAKATHLLQTKYDVKFTTIQVMTYRPEMTSSFDSMGSQHSEPI